MQCGLKAYIEAHLFSEQSDYEGTKKWPNKPIRRSVTSSQVKVLAQMSRTGAYFFSSKQKPAACQATAMDKPSPCMKSYNWSSDPRVSCKSSKLLNFKADRNIRGRLVYLTSGKQIWELGIEEAGRAS